jgi:hypothetical protein
MTTEPLHFEGTMSIFARRPVEPTHIPVPKGAVRLRQEIIDLVIEARKTKRPVRLYLVQQSGYLSEFFITSKSRLHKPEAGGYGLCEGPSFYKLTGMSKSGFGSRKRPQDRYYKGDVLMGSFNIEADGGAFHHRAFTNRKLAEEYSAVLKSDEIYCKYVRDWHSYCSSAFA